MHIETSNQPQCDLGFRGHSCNWGTHIAGLFETDAERDEIIFGFFATGDADGDLQLYCPHDIDDIEFRAAFADQHPDACSHLGDPAHYRILDPQQLYYPDGTFSPWHMEVGLEDFYRDSQSQGPRNIRAAAPMTWALESIPGVEHLMAYEARLNYFIPGKPWISICLYDVRRFTGATILNVLRTHPYALSGGVITANPYYQDPAEWLSDHAPQFLHRPD